MCVCVLHYKHSCFCKTFMRYISKTKRAYLKRKDVE